MRHHLPRANHSTTRKYVFYYISSKPFILNASSVYIQKEYEILFRFKRVSLMSIEFMFHTLNPSIQISLISQSDE
jgi:hypothetical protein